MKDDPFRSSWFHGFARDFVARVLPHLADSAYVLSIAPPDGTDADVRQATELGFAVLLDKPLIVIAPEGHHGAGKLCRIADHVVTGDISSAAGRAAIKRKLTAILRQ